MFVKLVVATTNEGKMREIRKILKEIPLEIVSMKELGLNLNIVEDADSFEGNAMKKAEEVMRACGEITLADDSGLVVDALGGAPGVYSARYAGEHVSDLENNKKLLMAMEGEEQRSAKFVAAIAVAFPDGRRELTFGEMKGEIAHEMRGSGGFGYDVLFYLPEYGMTSAQLSEEEKNRISHRAKALHAIKEKLGTL
jgi:XTP/dITP diphosphohydrolase